MMRWSDVSSMSASRYCGGDDDDVVVVVEMEVEVEVGVRRCGEVMRCGEKWWRDVSSE